MAILGHGAGAPCDPKKSLRLSHPEPGKFAEALRAVKGCGQEPQADKARGMAFHGLYQPDSAVFYLKRAFDAGTAEDATRNALAEALLWKKDFRTAGMVLEGVQDKQGSGHLKVLARRHEILGEFEQAVKLYDSAAAKEKLPYGTWERKAIVLSWMKRYDESKALFEAIIREKIVSAPLKIRCRIRIAEIRSWQKDFDGALSDLEKILAAAPKDADARLVKGRILEWKGEYVKALHVYREILQWDPHNPQANLRIEKLAWADAGSDR